MFTCVHTPSLTPFSALSPFYPSPRRCRKTKGFRVPPPFSLSYTHIHTLPRRSLVQCPQVPNPQHSSLLSVIQTDSATMSDADQEWKPSGRPTSFVYPSPILISPSQPPPPQPCTPKTSPESPELQSYQTNSTNT